MYSEEFQNGPLADREEETTDDAIDLETTEFEDEESAYLVTDEELDEGFQFQS